jgi:phenylalanyl-tRNA synthetase alpha chain
MTDPNVDALLQTLDRELERGRGLVADARTLEQVEAAEVSVLGRKSALADVGRSMAPLSEDARRQVGRRANEVRGQLTEAVAGRRRDLEAESERASLQADRVDVTLPGHRPRPGSLHPFTLMEREIADVLARMGFRIVEGPEAETEWHNFDALNIPPDHPARTMMDTIFLDAPGDRTVLRTHTSPMQIRTMEAQPPPVYIAVPGRVYRNEDVTAKNMPVFHQIEGLAVDEGITLADLKGTLETFFRALLGEDTNIRMTPSFFPFVEPGAQVEVTCFVCAGAGCATCGRTGWIELMGAGMVHPAVLENVGYDPDRFTGFAFGGGYDRLSMIRFGIPDIRMLWDSDVRFLERFEGLA